MTGDTFEDPRAEVEPEEPGFEGDAGEPEEVSPEEVAQHEPEAGGPSAFSASVGVNQITGDGTKVIANQIDELHAHLDGAFADGFSLYRPLSSQDFERFSSLQVRDRLRQLVFDQDEVQGLVDTLRGRRIVLLVAKSDTGKTQLAIAAAGVLVSLEGELTVWRSLQVIDRSRQVDLHHLVSGETEFTRSVIVLRDALHHGNPDLFRWVAAADQMTLQRLQETLQQVGSFLILTCDSEKCPDLAGDLQPLKILVNGPGVKERKRYLEARAKSRIERADLEAESRTELQTRFAERLATQGDSLLESLSNIGLVERFVEVWLIAYLQEADSDEALALVSSNVDRLDGVLQQAADHGVEDLAWLLAMIFCQSGLAGEAVEWSVFDHMRQIVLESLSRERHLEGARDLRVLCAETELLDRYDAEAIHLPDGIFLRFRDESRADRLWAALLRSGRRLLALLEPELIRFCEEGTPLVRRHAAQALVSLGRVGSPSVIAQRLSVWLQNASELAEPNLGDRRLEAARWVLRAVFAGGSQRLRDLCLERVDSFLGAGQGRRVQTGIFALFAMGELDLAMATGRLRRVLETLAQSLEILQTIDRELRGRDTKIGQLTDDRHLREAFAEAHQNVLQQILGKLFEPQEGYRILGASQYVLVGWIFRHGAGEVIPELNRWMPDGDEGSLAALLSLIFLRTDVNSAFAVLSRVTIRRVEEKFSWDPLLFSASGSPDGPRNLAVFLYKLYRGSLVYPSGMAQALQASLWHQIEIWIESSEKQASYRKVFLDVWHALCRSPHREFRGQLSDLLGRYELSSIDRPGNILEELREVVPWR